MEQTINISLTPRQASILMDALAIMQLNLDESPNGTAKAKEEFCSLVTATNLFPDRGPDGILYDNDTNPVDKYPDPTYEPLLMRGE